MAKLRYVDIFSILVYVIELIFLLFPEVSTFISGLQTFKRILLVSAMVVVPLLPSLVGRAQMIYSLFCKLFKVSDDEKKLLSIIWGNPDRDWIEEDLCKMTGLDIKRVHNLVRRLSSRGLIASGEVHSKEKDK